MSPRPTFLATFRSATLATPDGKPLFTNIDATFGPVRTGLVGRNGVGKSTLLRVIAGEIPLQSGSISRSGTLAFLRQSVQVAVDTTVADLMGVTDALARLDRMAAGTGSAEDAAEADWTLPQRIEGVMAKLDLDSVAPDRLAETLSGGQRTRAALAGILLSEPDLMLLDEPTNNLDDESRQIVRDVLANWRRGAIVVSHDRALLRQMDCIVELSPLGARAYGGGYDFYVERRAEERAAAERTLATAQRDAHRIEREAQAARERQEKRSGAGARSRSKGDQPKILMDAKRDRSQRTAGAQADIAGRRRQSAAEAVEKAEAAIDQFTGIGFRLPPTGLPAGRTVLAFAGVGYRHPGMRPVLDRFDFAITGPERIALTGRNGSGKSTFLRLGAGYLDAQTGQIVRPVKAALLDQTVGVLDAGDTILANFRRLNQEATDNHAHAMLARFLFRSADARRAVGTLSGGEMLRAGLACTLGATTPPQLLMLDEPTNHLDLDSIAAIEQALRDFDGALIIASHDADFLASVGVTRRLSFPLFPE